MEIKCKICGAINDGSLNYCKACYQPLDMKYVSADSTQDKNVQNQNIQNNNMQNQLNINDNSEFIFSSKEGNTNLKYKEKNLFALIFDTILTIILYSIIVTFLGSITNSIPNAKIVNILEFVKLIIVILLSTKSIFKKQIPVQGQENIYCFILFVVFLFARIPLNIFYFKITSNVVNISNIVTIIICELLIITIIVNYISNVINKKRKINDNKIYKLNIFSIVVTLILLVIGVIYK